MKKPYDYNYATKLSQERKEQCRKRREARFERAIRLARRDLEYDALHTPVSVEDRGRFTVEWRGQPRIGGCAAGIFRK